jgi:carboxyl-terminal processing protease
MLKREWRSALAWILLASTSTAPGWQVSAPRTEATAAPQEQKTDENADRQRRQEAFEIVWQTVKEYHYDPAFGGVDWDKVKEEFAPRVALARNDRELHLLLQQMLNRLGQSHFTIIPPEDIPAEEPDDAPDEGPDDAGKDAPKRRFNAEGQRLTEQLTHGIGIDLRLINGAAVLTRVDPASSAERAGLRPGFEIRSINGRSMRSILQLLNRVAVYQPQVKHQLSAELIAIFVNGPPGTFARLAYLDGLGRLRRAKIERLRLQGEMSTPIASMPSQFVEFEAKRLRGGVGYIRFNVFDASVMDKFCAALRSMKDAPGVVMDLRGNRGGLLGMIYGIGGLLETVPISLGAMSTRAGRVEFQVSPQRHPYAGPLIILLDGSSMSASEMFAAGLQEAGRAIIVGERSAGATLPSTVKTLPTGAILQYVFADFETASGTRLEGRGVNPDIPVKLERHALLSGHDTQLEAALSQALRLAQVHGRYLTGVAPPVPSTPPGPTAAETAVRAAAIPPVPEKPEELKSPNQGPTAAQIVEKYEQAIGHREVIEKLSTRVSKGRVEGSFAGHQFSGTVEIIEKAPNKGVTLITVPSLGVIRRGFTGTYGYEQIPLFGFREVKGIELDILRLSLEFYGNINLKRLYPSMTLKGKEIIGDSESYAVEMTPGYGLPSTFYFDVKTGLLKRQDSVYFEDYKEVDGLLIPFTIRGPNTVVKLTEVKHNVPVDDAQFVEREDCFTR